MMLIHGDQDERVPLSATRRFADALEAAGVPVELIVVEGGGHGPGFPGARQPAKLPEHASRWFEVHLAGAAGRR